MINFDYQTDIDQNFPEHGWIKNFFEYGFECRVAVERSISGASLGDKALKTEAGIRSTLIETIQAAESFLCILYNSVLLMETFWYIETLRTNILLVN